MMSEKWGNQDLIESIAGKIFALHVPSHVQSPALPLVTGAPKLRAKRSSENIHARNKQTKKKWG